MNWKPAAEQAVLGFLGYGAASLALSPSLLHFFLSALSGALVGAGYAVLRPLPWKQYVQAAARVMPATEASPPAESKLACVSVTRNLQFRQVSTKPPENMGFVRFSDLDKHELFDRLQGKEIDHGTIPFSTRVALEEGKAVEMSWESFEPHLRAVR